jgi:hypothetical protein
MCRRTAYSLARAAGLDGRGTAGAGLDGRGTAGAGLDGRGTAGAGLDGRVPMQARRASEGIRFHSAAAPRSQAESRAAICSSGTISSTSPASLTAFGMP